MALGRFSRLSRLAVAVLLAGTAVAAGLAAGVGSPGPALHAGAPAAATARPADDARTHAARSAAVRSAPAASRTPRPAEPTPAQALDVDREGPRVFPPNPNLPKTAPGASSAMSPYVVAPAPMGISDFGVGANGNYSYSTSSFEGFLNVTSFGAFSPTNVTNLSTPSPDWVALQLDAVAVNVSTPPASASPTATFWVENVVQLNGTTAQLEDNVWNFSVPGALMPMSSLSGKLGSILGPQEVYAAVGPTFAVTYPLSIALYDNISTVGVHTEVQFGYDIAGKGRTYDTVTFNGTASASSPSQFRVDGGSLNPYGSYYDTEFVLGGDGYGSNANLQGLSANASLLRWNATAGAYDAVPAAFDFGVDTSETLLGAAVSYSGTTERLSSGPSFLDGLWGTDGPVAARLAPFAPSGALEIRITVEPAYAFLFATNATLATDPLREAEYSYAPTTEAGVLTTYLPSPAGAADDYVFAAWADGYASANVTVGASTPEPVALTLASSPGTVDAPVYLRGSAQATAFGAAKVAQTGYSAAKSTLWLNASSADLVAPFLRTNEVNYPTFELLATLRLNTSVVTNGFTLASGVRNYTTSDGRIVPLVNWTQGYFFFYGDGRFTVENTTIQGNVSLAYAVSLTTPYGSPPSTVEFYEVAGPRVANLSAIDDAVGCTAVATTGANATDLAASEGALGLFASNSTGVGIDHASASGQDPHQISSSLFQAVSSGSVVASDLSVADVAFGFETLHVDGLTVTGLTVTSGATGFNANYTSSASVVGLQVVGSQQQFTAAGTWGNSSGLEFQQVAVEFDASGIYLDNDSGVTVSGGTSNGSEVSVVQSFYNSTKGTFHDLEAENASTAVDLQNCSELNLTDVTAIGNSTGAYVANASQVTGSGFLSTYQSIGLELASTTAATVSGFVASNQSAGIVAQNSTSLRVTNVSATNASFSPSFRVLPCAINQCFASFPNTAVDLVNDTTVTVTSVSAVNYSYAVWVNHTSRLTLSEVTAWNANISVSLNWTNDSTVQEVFSWGSVEGLLLANSTGTTIGASTFEASVGVGLALDNGSADTIASDNFVENNNTTYGALYNASRYQARSNNSTDPTFKGNYWSDWNGSASYTINATDQVNDGHPLSSFYSTYLRFTEKGLPVETNWSLSVGGHSYYLLNNSQLYLPGWIFGDGSIPFSVVLIYNYPPHPASGSVRWSGSSQSVQIFFGNLPPSGFPLPLWLVAAIAAAAAAAVAAVLFLRRRKARPASRSARTADPFEPSEASPAAGPPSPPAGGAR